MSKLNFALYLAAIICGGVITCISLFDGINGATFLGIFLIVTALFFSSMESIEMADSYYGYRQCDNHTVTTMHSVDVWRTKEGKQLRKVITTCGECGAANTRILTRNDVRKYIRDMD